MRASFGDQVTNLDLRSGHSIWERDARLLRPADLPSISPFRTDVVIVGAGITGAFAAERFTRAGRSVVIVDRHRPQRASTAAPHFPLH